MLERHILGYKTTARVWYKSVWYSYGPAVFAGSFTIVLIILQWVFNYELFYEILVNNVAGLTLLERINVFVDAMFNVFQYADDLTPISLILITFFQASAVTIWWRMHRASSAANVRFGSLGVGLLGSGCVACGSSILPILFNIVGSTLSVSLVQTIGDILLVLAVVLSYRAMLKLAQRSSVAV